MKKYDQYRFWYCKAEEEFDMAEEYKIVGMPMAAADHYLWHWVYLFRAAEANWYPDYEAQKKRSAKQQEQQRLWLQRGLLERTKANLRIILNEFGSNLIINSGVIVCDEYIDKNKEAFKTINQRIQS